MALAVTAERTLASDASPTSRHGINKMVGGPPR